ncbi:hypothetical protein DRN69_09400, partial [Candidatus Pacearchaeota archaeon]
LYPYDSFGKEINLKDFPNTFKYLKQFHNELSERMLDGKKITKWGKQWFSLWRIRSHEVFESSKILSPRLSTTNSFALDEKGEFYLTDSAVAIIPKDINIKYLLGLLNSKLLFFIIKNTSPFVQGKYYSYTKTYLEKLPIKIPETEKEKQIAEKIIKKVEEILELQKKFIDLKELLEKKETEKLYKFPSVSFHIKEGAEFKELKLEKNKIYINSDDFVEIKDQKIKNFVVVYLNSNKEKFTKAKDVKNLIYNIQVPKSEEVIKEIISLSKDKEGINEKNKKLEKEIDELVYELYGITEEEKGIIEGV